MNLNKLLKFSLGAFIALPTTLFFGNELFADNFNERYEFTSTQENILACGGGGGGGGGGGQGPKAKAAKAKKQAQLKLNFKKRQLSKAAAAGEPTDKLQAEIKALESQLLD